MIEQGTYATLGHDAIMASAKTFLKIGDTTDFDIQFEKIIDQGVRRLDCLSLFKKQVRSLKVTNGMAKLPNGFCRLIGLRIGTPPNCKPAIYVSVPFIKACGCGLAAAYIQSQFGVFEIQGGFIVFHPNVTIDDNGTVTTQEITDCTIAYFGYNVGDSGLMQIYEHYELALTHYVCWQYSWQNFDQYPQYYQEEHKRQWMAQKKYVKSVDFQNDGRNTKRQVMEVVNAVLVDKYWYND